MTAFVGHLDLHPVEMRIVRADIDQVIHHLERELILEPDSGRERAARFMHRKLDLLLARHLIPHRRAVERDHVGRQIETRQIERHVPIDSLVRIEGLPMRSIDDSSEIFAADFFAAGFFTTDLFTWRDAFGFDAVFGFG